MYYINRRNGYDFLVKVEKGPFFGFAKSISSLKLTIFANL